MDAAFEPLPNQRYPAVYLAPGPPGLSCLWCRDSQVAGCRYDAMESLVALALSGVQVAQKKHPMKSAGVAGRLVRAPAVDLDLQLHGDGDGGRGRAPTKCHPIRPRGAA